MNYPSIEVQNLLSENLLESLGQEKSRHRFAQLESFSWEENSVKANKKNYTDQIADAYENLIARWDLLSSDFLSMNLSDLREKWIKYFFSQFGFDLQYQKSAIEADSGNKFILSYRGWEGANAPIVHSSSFQQDLDDRSKEKTRKYSPHDTLQRFLNQANSDLWGIVTNGRYLRILRDFSHQSRKAYIQFDLEMLFEGRHYEDFRILWRLLHPSRFIPKEDEKCILENLFEESKNAGVAIGEDLRKNISLAIESLANGFLLATPELLTKLVDNNENCMQFYQQILRIIYRILFLFYAEQRRLMPTRSTLYAQEYSMSSLRDKIERGETIDEEQFDLWEGLKATFNMVYHGVQELGITPYNGQLFNPDSVHWLVNSQCRNDKLLFAIKYMSLFERGGITHRISYIELNVDEIGAIYESLLEYIPRISSKTETIESANKKNKHNSQKEISPNTFFLDPRGTSRKTSGSYYTHPGLVNALIESALVPVVETKVKEAGPNKDNQEKALLSLKICDPACGSAAFLIAATEYLGEKLAKIRIQDEYPNDTEIRHARRDILRHCIYGVDLNPMAVELAKVSLWLTAATNDLPLNFLDHKIKCGNSLISATPELIIKGIPSEAYSPVEGDDKNIARKRMKIAREYYKRREQERYQLVFNHVRELERVQIFQVTDLSEKYGEDSTREQKEIEKAYKKHREDYAFMRSKYIADYWTAAFFWKHNDDTKNYPTPMMLEYLLKNETVQLSGELRNKIKEIAEEYKFFHWHLEFAEVFKKGGFDCVLGNPPWERIKYEVKDFQIYLTNDVRKKLKRDNNLLGKFVRKSGEYNLSGVGDTNIYAVFVELMYKILANNGKAGIIVPTGIATDNTTKYLFQDIINNKRLSSIFDFDNKYGLFPSVHREYKFSLFTINGKNLKCTSFMTSFFLKKIEELKDLDRKIEMQLEDIKLFNPLTNTCPTFYSKVDYNIFKKIYNKTRFLLGLINEEVSSTIKLNIKFLRMFDPDKDKKNGLFFDFNFVANHKTESNDFVEINGKKLVPLYESKMVRIYDHRHATIKINPKSRYRKAIPIYSSDSQHEDVNFSVNPQFWVDVAEVNARKPNNKKWYAIYKRKITASSKRTLQVCITPAYGFSDSVPVIYNDNSSGDDELFCCFVANLNSVVLDFIVRRKMSYVTLSYFILNQLPIISPDYYLHKIKLNNNLSIEKNESNLVSLKSYIARAVLELTFNANNLKYFAKDLKYFGEPFKWNKERRLEITSELDAIFAHLYGITYPELSHILTTFPIIERLDLEDYGEYRTKRLILEKYNELKDKFKGL